ncbi:hypothetical protein BU14_0177s0015 [Porphyra umbilicalis]|uniref:DNA-directed RNA polymerase subunit n=1 Tax=Porphyra umbilicalis TaxID=2786 RepID=A0A1X6P7A6_PORUM|nr:hypothetical protein BU14_0177s0015 [Porphyra umbilicalis]|eukprot:OSX76734.1 hypothetical protein BU14_0177s0015 [Porphyra umbilicalis]
MSTLKEMVLESSAPKQIAGLHFGVLSADEIARLSHLEVTNRELYTMPSREAGHNSALDGRLGAINKHATCATCGASQAECIGHWGYVRLELPVFHIGYFKSTLQILQMICKRCSRVLLPDAARNALLTRLRSPALSATSHIRGSLLKSLWDRCKKTTVCPGCGAANGVVKRIGSLKIMHYPYGVKTAAGQNSASARARAAARASGSALDAVTDAARAATENHLRSTVKTPVRGAGGGRGDGPDGPETITHAYTGEDDGVDEDGELVAEEAATAAGARAGRGRSINLYRKPTKTELREKAKAAAVEGAYREAKRNNTDLERHLSRVGDDLNPLRTLALFEAMSAEDVALIDMRAVGGRPERLILRYLPVPPLCIRPTVCSDPSAGSTEDDLTMKLTEIVHMNNLMSHSIDKGIASAALMESWEWLQVEAARFINSESTNLPPLASTAKPLRGISQRLKGKTGRFRGNLSGKRVDFSGRTVISPDPNLRVDQVGIPLRVARTLTYPERVTKHNRQRLAAAVLRGPETYPGANFVETDDGNKRFLRYGNRKRVAKELPLGAVVERHLVDGDVVLFNRQPSLHRISIMAHSAKVVPHRTFRFNECVCAPYNADFDGDEMNLHVPQTEEARAEAQALMAVHANLVTPRNGEPLIAATQDFLTAAFLLTRKDMLFDAMEFSRICAFMDDAGGMADFDHHGASFGKRKTGEWTLPPPSIFKPVLLWTGKQVFSYLFASSIAAVYIGKDGDAGVRSILRGLTCEVSEKPFTLNGKTSNAVAAEMCVKDGWVTVRGGDLLSGQVGKKSLGAGCKQGILYLLGRAAGSAAAGAAMNRLAKLAARWHSDGGFSIGVGDVTPSAALRDHKARLMDAGYTKCDDTIEQLRVGKLVPRPGCSLEETLEALLNSELSKIREDAGQACISDLDPNVNAPLIMTLCGSKGSTINISQMVSCVGQQTVGGSRAPDGFFGRSLPHFPSGLAARTPAAKGFVENSFFSGMTSTEFFFHTMGGREGLVDTAVKTAETGYMQRRLMKALEDLAVHYDGTVRASDGAVVQVVYGDDGLDPSEMEAVDGDLPVNFGRSLADAAAAGAGGVDADDDLRCLPPEELMAAAEAAVATGTRGGRYSEQMAKLLRAFVADVAHAHGDARRVAEAGDGGGGGGADLPALLASIDAAHGVRAGTASRFFRTVALKVARATAEPGTAVGALGAQSIGEPGTQMTLKTFHFAGVASMNITQGVPRIKEIINASKAISTPIITAELVSSRDLVAARIVKARIERTLLGEVAEYIKEVYEKDVAYIAIRLDEETLRKVQLDVDAPKVARRLLQTPKLKLKAHHIEVTGRYRLRVRPAAVAPRGRGRAAAAAGGGQVDADAFGHMQVLRSLLPKVIVEGIGSVHRAVINEKSDGSYNLLVEGEDITSVMAVSGVDGEKVKCNHIMATEQGLGIEAARHAITHEIQFTMSSHGMSIDARHVALLADVMTFRGEVLGITRFGIAKFKTSTLMLASFEMTVDHLFDAAVHSRADAIAGVSECIIMGRQVPLGTGLFKLLRDGSAQGVPRRRDGGDAMVTDAGAEGDDDPTLTKPRRALLEDWAPTPVAAA